MADATISKLGGWTPDGAGRGGRQECQPVNLRSRELWRRYYVRVYENGSLRS